MSVFSAPTLDCPLCPRLVAFRQANRIQYPSFFNAPVPSFGALEAELLVVGLAPGLKGANQTGRPFTGDYAGIILYSSLLKNGFAKGNYNPEALMKKPGDQTADGFELVNCRITNAVRCVPQQNKPEPSEIKTCNNFLKREITAMPSLKVILSLGGVSHKAVLMALGLKQSAYKFGHGLQHTIPCHARGSGHPDLKIRLDSRLRGNDIILLNSYHTSRYNINTGALTQAMFDAVVERAKNLIKG